MTLKLELPPNQEAALREAAAKEGLTPEAFLLRAAEEWMRRPEVPRVAGDEAALLSEIGAGLPPVTWGRYHALIRRRQDEVLTPDEQVELIRLSDEVEAWNARRLSLLIELARLRGTSLPAVMDQLGLSAPPYA